MTFTKKAGVPCPHLTEGGDCALFGKPERPPVCNAWNGNDPFGMFHVNFDQMKYLARELKDDPNADLSRLARNDALSLLVLKNDER
jgi:hypothetical protein